MTRPGPRKRPDRRKVTAWRAMLHERQSGRCYYCGLVLDLSLPDTFCGTARRGPLPPEFPTFDHVHPVAKGGRWKLDNLVLSCPPCNSRKSDKPAPVGWAQRGTVGAEMLSRPVSPWVEEHLRSVLV